MRAVFRTMFFSLLAIPLLTIPSAAQGLGGLTTTRDGSALYFSGSLRESPMTTNIYRWTREEGTVLFAQKPELAEQSPIKGSRLSSPQVSSDGTILSYH